MKFKNKAETLALTGVIIIAISLSNIISYSRQLILAIGFGLMLRGIFISIKKKKDKE